MKVLVTGGAGYIGSHTSVELLNAGCEVVCIDNLMNSKLEAVKRVEKITGKSVKFYQGDIRDRAILDKIFTENKIDSVINFAIARWPLEKVGAFVCNIIKISSCTTIPPSINYYFYFSK